MSVVKKTKFFVKGLQKEPIYLYTKNEKEQFEDYVKRNFGEVYKVYHELYSPDIHLDILIVPPTKDSNYYKLITMGMGAYKMNVPKPLEKENIDRAELVAFLPPDWDMNMNNDDYNWIISELKKIGRTPIEENSWIRTGHIFSNDVKCEIPFSNNTKLSSAILLPAKFENDDEYHVDLKMDNKGVINFYQIFPMYKEEMEYMMEHNNINEFIDLFFKDNDDLLIINPHRKNVCENKIEKEFNNDDYELEK